MREYAAAASEQDLCDGSLEQVADFASDKEAKEFLNEINWEHLLSQAAVGAVPVEKLSGVFQTLDTDEASVLATLQRPLEELNLAVRGYHALFNDKKRFVGDIMLETERELLRVPSFGRRSLNELKGALREMGLVLQNGDEVEITPVLQAFIDWRKTT